MSLGLSQEGSGSMMDSCSPLSKADNYHRRQDLELRSILRVWNYHWRAITLIAIGITLATLLIVSCQERLYTADSLIKLTGIKNYILKAGRSSNKDQRFNPIIANSIVYMSSNDFLSKVADRALLYSDPEFSDSGHVTASTAEGIVLETLADRLIVSQRSGSRVIAIEMTSRDPEKAARIANLAARLFIDQEIARLEAIHDKVVAWLRRKIRTVQADLAVFEGQAVEIARKHGLKYTGRGDVVDQIADIRYMELTRQLAIIKAGGGELKARYEQALSSEEDQAGAVGLLSGRAPSLRALRNLEVVLETRLSDLKGDLGERHPEIISLKKEVAATQRQISDERTRAINGIKNELIINNARQAEIESRILIVKKNSKEIESANIKLNEIIVNIASKKDYLSTIQNSYYVAQDDRMAGIRVADVLSSATTPTSFSQPNIRNSVTYAMPIGLLLGLIGIFFYERWVSDFGFKSLLELRTAGLQPLGIIPELPKAEALDLKLEDYVLTHPHSAQAEAFQRIRGRLCEWYPWASGESKVVLVTSSSPSEGKTSMAVTLARQMTRANSRVLLIDTNIRNPSVAEALNLESKPGLFEMLSFKAPEDVKIYQDPHTNMDIILPGRSDLSIGDLLRSSQMDYLIDEVRRHYDWIFLDSAALGAVADSLILARHADMIVYVAQWLKTTRNEVCASVSHLCEIGGDCVGVALTRVDIDACDKYEHLEEVRHYGYYSSTPSIQGF